MKSKSVIKKVCRRGSAAVGCSRFWIIDTESPGVRGPSYSAIGPFRSISDAEMWIRADAEETYLDSDKSLRDMADEHGWSAPQHIVEVRKTVTPVPSVVVTVRLKTENR